MGNEYRDDLAYIHDVGFGRFAEGAANVLLAELKKRRKKTGLVVDLGSGSGILAEKLTNAGFDVHGVDLSPAMIQVAQKRAPKATFHQGSLFDADIPSCIAVTMVGECSNYLFDATNSRKRFQNLLARIHDALPKRGIFLFDTAEPGRVPPPGQTRNFFEADDWAVLVEAIEDKKRKSLTRNITTFRKEGSLYRRTVEIHKLRLVPRIQILSDLRQAGFKPDLLKSYADTKFPPGFIAFLAEKP